MEKLLIMLIKCKELSLIKDVRDGKKKKSTYTTLLKDGGGFLKQVFFDACTAFLRSTAYREEKDMKTGALTMVSTHSTYSGLEESSISPLTTFRYDRLIGLQ